MKKLILDGAALGLQLALLAIPIVVAMIPELRAESAALRDLERILYMRNADNFDEQLERWRNEKHRIAKRASNRAFAILAVTGLLELLFVMNYFTIGRAAGY